MMPVFTFRRSAPFLVLLQSCFQNSGLIYKKAYFFASLQFVMNRHKIDIKQQNFHQFRIANWKNLCYDIQKSKGLTPYKKVHILVKSHNCNIAAFSSIPPQNTAVDAILCHHLIQNDLCFYKKADRLFCFARF